MLQNGQDETGDILSACPEIYFFSALASFFEIMSSNFIVVLKICRVVFPEVGDYPFIGKSAK